MDSINKAFFTYVLSRPSLLKALLRWSDFSAYPQIQSLRNRVIASSIEGIYTAGQELRTAEAHIRELERDGINTIINFAMESASDEGKVKMKLEYRDILDCLKRHPSSCVALKPTSLISYKLIKDIADEVQDAKYPAVDFSRLVLSEKMERVTLPLTELAIAAAQIGARLLIDAEQSELQPAVDLMALYLMQKVNKTRSIVYNTYQLYLQDSGLRALAHQKWLHENGANFAAKFVRGAYLSHEFSRQKSSHPNYRLCASKALTDQNYNENALMFCGGQDPIIFATHNAGSVKMIGSSIIRHRRQNLHEFAYLMGFRHRISEVLSGFKTLEYVPYGPTDVKIPYLLRRLEENADIMSK